MSAHALRSKRLLMSVPQWLPTELWKHIFRYATAEESQFHETRYHPFQPTTPGQSKIALALSRVSKQWQAIAAEFLFREVWLGHGLLESLKGSQLLSEGCGRYVRRLELPSKLVHHDISNPIRLLDILACCPHLQILVKRSFKVPQDAEFWSNLIPAAHPRANGVVLKSLERIEWSSSDGLILEACGSALSDLVFRLPNLRYLSISWPGPIFRNFNRDAYPHLPPSLTTLRRRSFRGPDSAGIGPDDIPRLTHLICDPVNLPSESGYFLHGGSSVLDVALSELRVLEVCRVPHRHDLSEPAVNEFLKRCPNLQELAYHVGSPQIPLLDEPQCLELKKVNLRIESLDDLRQRYGSNDEWFWRLLGLEFVHLYGCALPALEHVILHGDWDYIVHAAQFRPLRQRLLDRGCSLEYPDGKPVQ